MKMLKFKLIAAVFATCMITANATSAQAVRASYSVSAEEPFSVKYLGTDENYLLFEVVVKSTDNKTASLGISDKSEGELYANNFRTNLKVQTIKIEKRDNQELNFKLELGKAVYNKSFSINTSLVENIVVSENAVTVL